MAETMRIMIDKIFHFMMFALAVWKINMIKVHMLIMEVATKR